MGEVTTVVSEAGYPVYVVYVVVVIGATTAYCSVSTGIIGATDT